MNPVEMEMIKRLNEERARVETWKSLAIGLAIILLLLAWNHWSPETFPRGSDDPAQMY